METANANVDVAVVEFTAMFEVNVAVSVTANVDESVVAPATDRVSLSVVASLTDRVPPRYEEPATESRLSGVVVPSPTLPESRTMSWVVLEPTTSDGMPP